MRMPVNRKQLDVGLESSFFHVTLAPFRIVSVDSAKGEKLRIETLLRGAPLKPGLGSYWRTKRGSR